MSRPHAEELKEQLCCDRGRAARPSELGEGALRGGVPAGEGWRGWGNQKRVEGLGRDGDGCRREEGT